MKKLFYMLLTMLFATSCTHHDASKQQETMTFADDYNREVVIPKYPQRIVSLSPAVTQIIFALHGEGLLVGRTEYCTYPAEALKIENVGGISNMNVEKVLSLNPDLVISGSMVPQASVEQINNMGVPFVSIIEKSRFDDLYGNITQIGLLINRQSEADSLCDMIHDQVAHLTPIDTTRRPSIYYVIGYGKGGNFTAGGNTFIDDMISMAGGRNIAHDMEGWEYSLEALIAQDPDFILLRDADVDGFCNTVPYKNLSAVRNGHIIVLNSNMIDLQVPLNIEAIKLINKEISKK